jgi:hypothetical protein
MAFDADAEADPRAAEALIELVVVLVRRWQVLVERNVRGGRSLLQPLPWWSWNNPHFGFDGLGLTAVLWGMDMRLRW